MQAPRKNVPRAIRRVFWRILFFYVIGVFVMGLIVSSTDEGLLHNSGTSASPWVIAIRNAGIKGLPSVVNAVVLISAFVSRPSPQLDVALGIALGADLDSSLRSPLETRTSTLRRGLCKCIRWDAREAARCSYTPKLTLDPADSYGLACDGKAPAIFRRCTKNGLPIYCLAITAAFGLLVRVFTARDYRRTSH